MKRRIIVTRGFGKAIDELIHKRKLSEDDYTIFKREIAEHPEMGDIIPGTGGIRRLALNLLRKVRAAASEFVIFTR